MKLKTLLSIGIISLTSFSVVVAQEGEKPQPAAEKTEGYQLYAPSLTSGPCSHSGLITSAEVLAKFLKENPTTENKLAAFLRGVDFTKQSIFLYGYKHGGSGADRPASKTELKDGILTVSIYDQNTSSMKTMDFRESFHHVAIIVDKNAVKEIKVLNNMHPKKVKEESFVLGEK